MSPNSPNLKGHCRRALLAGRLLANDHWHWRLHWRLIVSRWLPLVAWMAVIFTLSGLSQADLVALFQGILRLVPFLTPEAATTAKPPPDGLLHLAEFAILAYLIHRIPAPRLRRRRLAEVAVLAASFAYALTDEFHQLFVPGRDASPIDLGYDFIGALVGLTAAKTVGFLRRRWRRLLRSANR